MNGIRRAGSVVGTLGSDGSAPARTTGLNPEFIAGAALRVGLYPRTGAWLVLAVAVLYAPIALSSLWFAFDPGTPQLQEQLDAWVGDKNYATGPGSISAVRDAVYAQHRWVMLAHTTLGGTALVFVAVQLASIGRLGRRAHVVLGRAYMLLMASSMSAALLFLLRSHPAPGVGQTAFRCQLWALALSTLGSAFMAIVSARRADVVAHRSWMMLNVSFLLTAPLLRVLWTCFGGIFPDQEMLTNIEVGAVALAVLAPAGGVMAALFGGQRRAETIPPPSKPVALSRVCLWPDILVAVLGCAAIVARFPGEVVGPPSYPWFHVVPVLAYVAICASAALRAHRGIDEISSRHWRLTLACASAAPWAAVIGGTIAALSLGDQEGYVVGLMVAPGTPVVAGLWLYLAMRPGEHGARRIRHGATT